MSGRSMRRLVYVSFVVNFALAALLLAWWLPDLRSPDGSLVYRFGWVLLMTGLLAGLTFSIGQVTGWIADVTGMTEKAHEEDRERRQLIRWRVGAQALKRETERLRKMRDEMNEETATRLGEEDPAKWESAKSESEPEANSQGNKLDGSS